MTLRDKYVDKLEDENDELRERIRLLEENLGMRFEAPLQFMFTHNERILFGVLLKNNWMSRQQAMNVLYSHKAPDDEAEIKIVDVWVCKMRKKLKPYGVEIKTKWGEGYFIPSEGKQVAKTLLAGINSLEAAE